jgi:hypothetical protein
MTLPLSKNVYNNLIFVSLLLLKTKSYIFGVFNNEFIGFIWYKQIRYIGNPGFVFLNFLSGRYTSYNCLNCRFDGFNLRKNLIEICFFYFNYLPFLQHFK